MVRKRRILRLIVINNLILKCNQDPPASIKVVSQL
jgi:hypothetical protein